MSKTLKVKGVIRRLEKVGFVLRRITGSHNIFIHPVTKRRVIVPVHGNQDVSDWLLSSIAKMAGIDLEEFINLLE